MIRNQSIKEITNCRISGEEDFISVLNLGNQFLTGVFPNSPNQNLTKGPLELIWPKKSKLLQLRHSYPQDEMYGDNYGYRSGLNKSMVDHLKAKVHFLNNLVEIKSGDLVLDIGSNDGTTLNSYPEKIEINRVGIDPTARKFKEYYNRDIKIIDTFFSKETFFNFNQKKAKIISSIAMFYDLEDPVSFASQIYDCLEDNGIWHFEQSYMPSMLRTNSYDTICHEHLEYYSLSNIIYILEKVNMKIVDIQFNSINGGSFAITAAKNNGNINRSNSITSWLLKQESRMGIDTPAPFRRFEERIFNHRLDLMDLLNSLKKDGYKIAGYGASTKGNVLLQFCELNNSIIDYIVDVNPLKNGCFTPGTLIPIVSEQYALDNLPDFFLVLPWHFRNNIIQKEQYIRDKGVKMIFPLPEIEII